MNNNLIIRADANTRIGTGHIMRCIALAQAWQDHRGEVTFLSHCESETIRQRIQNEGFEFIPIDKPHPDPSDLTQTLNVLKHRAPCTTHHEPSWLVLDGYHFTPDYQKAVKDSGYRLLVIDDMAHLDYYYADILVNQNINAPELNYSCDKNTIRLLGCDYVMLRREFLEYRNWKREIPEKARKILATLGGGDPNNVTLKVIKALKLLNDPDLEVKVVVGPSNPHLEKLQSAICNPQSAIHILQNVTDMPSIMAWADMAITAGGTTCWEFVFMGVPSITIMTSENQQDVVKGLESVKIFKTMGWWKAMNNDILVTELATLIQNKNLREKNIRLGRQLINGNGTKNVIYVLAGQHTLKH